MMYRTPTCWFIERTT